MAFEKSLILIGLLGFGKPKEPGRVRVKALSFSGEMGVENSERHIDFLEHLVFFTEDISRSNLVHGLEQCSSTKAYKSGTKFSHIFKMTR